MRMGNPSLPLKLVFIISFSLTSSSFPFSNPKPQNNHFHYNNSNSITIPIPIRKSNSKKNPSATAGDILSLLGTSQQAVNPQVAADLKSCFKFLVPFTPIINSPSDFEPRRLLRAHSERQSRNSENELVWSPPAPVLEIARLAFQSSHDDDHGSFIDFTLDPAIINVPDVEGSNECKCELTRTPYGRRFINKELNTYMEFLFKLIVARGPEVGLDVSLNRYDFFHGHLFIADNGRVGILFHAKEYPAYDKEVFPYNMGYCQKGSDVTYDKSMNLRNILWLAPLPSNSTSDWSAPGVLVVLDARPGGIIYRDIIPSYAKYARTIYEEYFGDNVVDVNYLNVGTSEPNYQLFIC